MSRDTLREALAATHSAVHSGEACSDGLHEMIRAALEAEPVGLDVERLADDLNTLAARIDTFCDWCDDDRKVTVRDAEGNLTSDTCIDSIHAAADQVRGFANVSLAARLASQETGETP